MFTITVEISKRQVREILDDCSSSDLTALGVTRPTDLDQLGEWIEVLLAGDRRTALAMVGSVFEDEGSRAVCERVLLSSPRRAA